MFELSALGFGPFFSQQLSPEDGELIVARVAAEHRGGYELWSAGGAGRGQLSGRLRRELERTGLPGAGDWVVVDAAPSAERPALIERLLSRRTVFTRGAAGREVRAQVVAANVDRVFVVCGLDADFNLRRIERYLARIWASGAEPAIVLSKADLCAEVELRQAEVERRAAGVPVHVTSALHARGLEAVRDSIQLGMTVALVGSSGAGKSTLVNALLGEERMPTQQVRERDGRGTHTTTHRQLLRLPGGGLLLDTPGMRELQLVDEEGLGAVFGDIAALAEGCRYRDCRHDAEPGCAVKEAVAAGALDTERLEHLRALEREARAYELRNDVRKRRQVERAGGRLSDQAAEARRWRGK